MKDPAEILNLVQAALETTNGAALVLDHKLYIRAVTASAHRLLGAQVHTGDAAPRVLCGDSPKRPFAEALAEGRPIQAIVPTLGAAQTAMVRIRAIPLPTPPGGWVLLLDASDGQLTDAPVLFHGMWSQDARMKELFRVITRVAPDNVTVLVRGETGTGKELVARALHDRSTRKAGPFRALNCAALPTHLLESELFGHVRGAFTGAVKDTPGHVQLAHNGTLFLDEVAELPVELQPKLLRVLETRTVIPVGAREPVAVDVRIVAATHRSLRKEVEAGRFRADLMYRLRVIPVFLPPLRERRGDIELLCEKLIGELSPGHRRKVDAIHPLALSALERHDWPGNIRELRNVLTYAFSMGDGPTIELRDLPPELIDPALVPSELVTRSLATAAAPETDEATRLRNALARAGGNRSHAARILGINRVTLWRKLKAAGLV